MLKEVVRRYFKFYNVSIPACSSMLKDDLQLSDSEDSDSDQVSSVHPTVPGIHLNPCNISEPLILTCFFVFFLVLLPLIVNA